MAKRLMIVIIFIPFILVGYNLIQFRSFLGVRSFAGTNDLIMMVNEYIDTGESTQTSVLELMSSQNLRCTKINVYENGLMVELQDLDVVVTTSFSCDVPPIWIEGKFLWNLFNPANYAIHFFFSDGELVLITAPKLNYLW